MAHDVESRPALGPGSLLAGYRIEGLVGRGGMGVVYLAADERLGRRVALKLLKPELAADGRFRERFLRESKLAASLDHSHVVPIYEAGEVEGQLYISMRYVPGEDLKTLLQRDGSFEPARAVELCAQVAEALDAAHAIGLVHRDVKPANVLLTSEGEHEHCYLVDFGLALAGEGEPLSEQTLHLSGTPDCVSPEQIGGKPSDHRADVYSLGCLLYECLTGVPPFHRVRPMATLFAHLTEPPPSPHTARPELPDSLDTVIATALAKAPEERYQSCGELIDAARDALGLSEPRISRRKLLLAGGAAALAVAAAATVPAVLLTRGSNTAPKSVLPLKGDSLVRIDPATAELTAAVPARNASWVGANANAVWYADRIGKTLTRIDPSEQTLIDTFDISSIPRLDVFEASPAAIWVAKDSSTPIPDALAGRRALWRVDAKSGSIEVVGLRDTWIAYDLAAAGGSLWAANLTDDYRDQSLLRIDARTGKVVATISTTPEGSWGLLTVGLGSVWLLSGESLRRFDPQTKTVTGTLTADLVGLPTPERERGDRLVAGAGALWLLSVEDESVSRIDPSSARIVARVGVGRIPTGLVLGGGALWVTSDRDGTVTRIDPRSLDSETIPVGGPATSIAAGADAIWITVSGPRRSHAVPAAGEAPLRKGLAAGMYGGPTGFPGAERYQYPLDSAEGRVISALRRMRRDGRAPDRLVVQVFDLVIQQLTYPFRKGAPPIAQLFEEETGIKLQFVPVPLFGSFDTNLRNAKTKNFSLDVITLLTEELGTLAEAGILRTLDDLVLRHDPQWLDPTFGYAGGESTVAKLTRYRGATYAVATDLDAQPYFYRGDLLDDPREQATFADRYGRELRFPLTWDEQAEVAEFFTRRDASPPLYGDVATLQPFWGVVNWYQRFVCSAAPNLRYFNVDGSAAVSGEAGVRAFEELLRSLAWHPPKAIAKDWNAQYRLMGGCSGFGGSSYPNLTQNVVGTPDYDKGCGKLLRSDVSPGRIVDGALVRRPVTHASLQHGVNAFAEQTRQEVAYLFLQWLGGARVHTLYVISSGGFGIDPVHAYSLDDPYVARGYRPQPTGQLKNIIPRTAPTITIDRGVDYQGALSRELLSVLQRQRTPEQAAKRLEERWNRITEQAGVETQVEALRTYFQGFPRIVDPPGQELQVQEVSTTVT